MAGRSEKLAQEGLRGNRDWNAVGKRVGFGVWEVSHDLKCVRGTRGFLHGDKRRRNPRVRRFRFDEKPGRTALRYQKIHLRLCLVPYVVERIVAKTEIVPHVNGLEKMAGNEVFKTRSFVRHFAPVPLIPLRSFLYRVFDQYHSGVYIGTVITKLFKTIEWYMINYKNAMTVELTNSISLRYNSDIKHAERLAPTSHSAKQSWAQIRSK